MSDETQTLELEIFDLGEASEETHGAINLVAEGQSERP